MLLSWTAPTSAHHAHGNKLPYIWANRRNVAIAATNMDSARPTQVLCDAGSELSTCRRDSAVAAPHLDADLIGSETAIGFSGTPVKTGDPCVARHTVDGFTFSIPGRFYPDSVAEPAFNILSCHALVMMGADTQRVMQANVLGDQRTFPELHLRPEVRHDLLRQVEHNPAGPFFVTLQTDSGPAVGAQCWPTQALLHQLMRRDAVA